jgi:hypothetical protein
MNMLPGDEATNAITEKIIGCAFRVRDKLKCGFLEKVYENAERRIRPRATKKRPRTYLTDRPATRTRRNFSHGRDGQTRTVNSIRQKSAKLSASPLFWVLPEIRARPQKWISQLHYSLFSVLSVHNFSPPPLGVRFWKVLEGCVDRRCGLTERRHAS